MTDIRSIFSEDGELDQALSHYSPREAQIEMAEAVQHAIEEHETVIIEAGTGTGKTFAYLIPALLSGKKVIVSTGTKHLQDQLYDKDLPLLKKIFKYKPVSTALLKGRSNYLCLYRIKTLRQRGRFENKKQVDDFYRIERYAQQDPIGDITKIENFQDSTLFSHVTSTTENCLHTECPDYEDCFIFKARKKAMESDIIVINHHLFCADLSLKQEGFGELLPEADCIIIDEAHQLAETAGLFFSEQVGTKAFYDWLEDFNRLLALEASDFSSHDDIATNVIEGMIELRKMLPEGTKRYALTEFYQDPKIADQLAEIADQLLELVVVIKPLIVRSKTLAQIVERMQEFQEAWTKITVTSQENPDDNAVVWIETYVHHLIIASTPLDISEIFQKNSRGLKAGWVFTSATLAVNGKFAYFCAPLGLSDKNSLCLKSPFNYKTNALFYHPPALPEPNHPTYISKFIHSMLPVITEAKGRTFILFTSYRALNEAAEILKKSLSQEHI